MFIKLMIESNGSKFSFTMQYNKKLYKAVKYLDEIDFGGRTDVLVKKFALEKFGIYRFALHFKVKIGKEIEFAGTTDFEKFDNIIAQENYASTTLTISVKNWGQPAI